MEETVESSTDDIVRVPRIDLYALLDNLNSMYTGLTAVWDPDATIHPLSDARRKSASRALLNSIVDIRHWLEQCQPESAEGDSASA